MKKTAKIILSVCCAAFLLFLLLPFLETTAPSPSVKNETAKAEPQIFTSNPLTELVGRIARFFRTRQTAEAQQPPATHITAGEADELFGEPQGAPLYASAQSAGNASGTDVFSADGAAYADAYLKNEEGEWVLIRQTSPEGSTRGMHEINVKDNAYDRYVTQERQARFTPVMRVPAVKEEVPDSRLARVFNPIKRLFNIAEKPAAPGVMQGTQNSLAAAKGAASSRLDRNNEKSSSLPKFRTFDWDGFRNNPFSAFVPGSAEAAEAFLNLLNPGQEIDNTADWLADIKYSRAQSPEEQEEKEQFRKQWKNAKKQQVNREMQEIMVRRNAGKEPENILERTLGCGDGSVSKQACSITGQDQAEQQPDMAALKENSAQRFFEQTGKHLPPAGITVVLNASDMPVVDEELFAEWDDPPKKLAAELYMSMQNQCQDNCYWVATGADKNSELAQTIEAAGLTLKGDPLNRYDQYVQNFLEEQRQQNMPEEELQQLKQQLEENKTHYTAYSQSDLHRMFHDTMDLFKQQARPEDAAVPFFTHVQNAYDFHQRSNYPHPVFYGEGGAVNGDKSLEERAADFTDELAQFVNDVVEITHKVKQAGSEEGAKAMAQPAIQQMQEQLKNEIDNFNKTNDLGKTKK